MTKNYEMKGTRGKMDHQYGCYDVRNCRIKEDAR